MRFIFILIQVIIHINIDENVIFLVDTEENRATLAMDEKEYSESNDTESISVTNVINEIVNDIGQNVKSMCFKIFS